MPKPSPPELQLEPPESIRLGEQTVRCGGTVYRAVSSLLRSNQSLESFCGVVWGKVPESKDTVYSLIYRANRLLIGLGSEQRVLIDGDRVSMG